MSRSNLLLLLAEPLELALDLLAGLLVLGGLERRLQLLEPGVEVRLALGEFLEPVGDLAGLLLLLLLLRLGLGPRSAARSGSRRPSIRAGRVAAADCCCEALAWSLLLCWRCWRVTSNSRARSSEQGLIGGLLGGERRGPVP